MEEKDIINEKETIEEENKEVIEEEIQEVKEEIEQEELSDYEKNLIQYEYRLEEALVNIEIKENAALANEEDLDAINEYKKAKEDYETLRKEYKQYKKENEPASWWNTLPLRVKIVSLINIVFAFPFLSWSIIHFWYYPYLWFYNIFSDGLNKLFNNGRETLVYIYLGIFWYLLVAILIGLVIYIFVKRKKDDVNPKYKKTYIGFVIGNAILVLGLLIYEIVTMITMWS